jgi:hypothetical protein
MRLGWLVVQDLALVPDKLLHSYGKPAAGGRIATRWQIALSLLVWA